MSMTAMCWQYFWSVQSHQLAESVDTHPRNLRVRAQSIAPTTVVALRKYIPLSLVSSSGKSGDFLSYCDPWVFAGRSTMRR